jgi:hypothetical protein
VQRPVHRELLGDGCERRGQLVARVRDVELDSLEKKPRFGVRVLVRFHDVAASFGHERADARDDARAVGAPEKERGSHES